MTHVTKITKNHLISNLTSVFPIIIFVTKMKFLIKFFDHVTFLTMSQFLIMSQCDMITKPHSFSYSILKSNIHHISYVTSHLHAVKTQVSSNLNMFTCFLKISTKCYFLLFSTFSSKIVPNLPIIHHLGNFLLNSC